MLDEREANKNYGTDSIKFNLDYEKQLLAKIQHEINEN